MSRIKPLSQSADIESGERNMWRAVLEQARSDATSPNDSLDRKQARAWFTDAGKDFRHICSLADLDPVRVQREALKLIEASDKDTCSPPRSGPRAKTYTFNGETRTLTGWAKHIGVSYEGLQSRLKKGWTLENALTAPPNEKMRERTVTFDGHTLSLADWSKRTGINTRTLASRIAQGWSIDRALTEPVNIKQALAGARSHSARRGVGRDFSEAEGTGGGSVIQDSTLLAFQPNPEFEP